VPLYSVPYPSRLPLVCLPQFVGKGFRFLPILPWYTEPTRLPLWSGIGSVGDNAGGCRAAIFGTVPFEITSRLFSAICGQRVQIPPKVSLLSPRDCGRRRWCFQSGIACPRTISAIVRTNLDSHLSSALETILSVRASSD
jgi:hypothetical protein